LVPDELKRLHSEDFQDDSCFDLNLNSLARQLSEPRLSLAKLVSALLLLSRFRRGPTV
jgi:hypothetical protein